MIKKRMRITTITAKSFTWENGTRVEHELPTVTTLDSVNEKNAAKRYLAKNNDFEGDILVTGYATDEVVGSQTSSTIHPHHWGSLGSWNSNIHPRKQ